MVPSIHCTINRGIANTRDLLQPASHSKKSNQARINWNSDSLVPKCDSQLKENSSPVRPLFHVPLLPVVHPLQ